MTLDREGNPVPSLLDKSDWRNEANQWTADETRRKSGKPVHNADDMDWSGFWKVIAVLGSIALLFVAYFLIRPGLDAFSF